MSTLVTFSIFFFLRLPQMTLHLFTHAFDAFTVNANIIQINQHHCWDLGINLEREYIIYFSYLYHHLLLKREAGQDYRRSV